LIEECKDLALCVGNGQEFTNTYIKCYVTCVHRSFYFENEHFTEEVFLFLKRKSFSSREFVTTTDKMSLHAIAQSNITLDYAIFFVVGGGEGSLEWVGVVWL